MNERRRIVSLLAAGLLGIVGTSSAGTGIVGCEPAGEVPVSVSLQPPSGASLAGVKITLDYPEGRVAIPGWQNAPEVQDRITGVPKDFLVAPNDTDTQLIVSLAGVTGLPTGEIFRVRFDRCQGGEPVSASDFHCTVAQASDPQAKLVKGATCVVHTPTADRRDAHAE